MAGSVWRVRDELWEAVKPLIPEHSPDPRGGRPRVDDRICFNAIVFVLFTGIASAPSAGRARMFTGDRAPSSFAVAERRRLAATSSRAPSPAERRRETRLVDLGGRRQPCPCPFGGLHTGPSPVDRARSGSKHHLITDFERHSACDQPDRRQSQRLHPALAARRRRRPGDWQAGASTKTHRAGARRSWL